MSSNTLAEGGKTAFLPVGAVEMRGPHQPFTVGYFMQDARQHACPTVHISQAAGLEFIEAQVKLIVPKIHALATYVPQTAMKNKKTTTPTQGGPFAR